MSDSSSGRGRRCGSRGSVRHDVTRRGRRGKEQSRWLSFSSFNILGFRDFQSLLLSIEGNFQGIQLIDNLDMKPCTLLPRRDQAIFAIVPAVAFFSRTMNCYSTALAVEIFLPSLSRITFTSRVVMSSSGILLNGRPRVPGVADMLLNPLPARSLELTHLLSAGRA